MSKTLLITGGSGFMGSHFIRHISETYPSYKIINLDNLSNSGNPKFLDPLALSANYRFVRGDVSCLEDYYSMLEHVDTVVHFAGLTGVDRSFKEIDAFIHTNVEGTQKLLLAMRNLNNLKTFIYVSSDEVYGSVKEGYIKENAQLNPSNPYAKTKATAERLVKDLTKDESFSTIIVRPCNVFGPNQHIERFIPKIIANAFNNFSVPIYGDGNYYREWIYVKDCVQAIDLLLHRSTGGEVYNIGSNNVWSNYDLARKIIKICHKSDELIEFVTNRIDHDKRRAVDCSKIEALGFQIRSDFDLCLLRTMDYYLNLISDKISSNK